MAIDGRGLIAIPGLINGHVHLNDAPLKDLGVGKSLDEVAHPVIGLKRTALAGLSVAARVEAMDVALAEMVGGGTTTAVNFHEEKPELLAAAMERSPAASILKNLGRPSVYSSSTDIEHNTGFSEEEVGKFRKELGSYDGVGLSGANEYSDKALEQVASADDVLRAIHAAESRSAVEASLRLTGRSEVSRVMAHLKPDLLVHMTNAGAEDIRMAAEGNVSVVCCPRSNAILGNGSPPVKELIRSGVKVGLGTDNVMINSPDMFREMDYTSRMIRSNAGDPAAVECVQLLKMATSNCAEAVGIGQETGALEVGLYGDIVLLDKSGGIAGTRNIYSAIVHRAAPGDVAATVKRGVILHETSRIKRLE